MSELVRFSTPPVPQLRGAACFQHGRLFLILTIDRHSLEEAHTRMFGVRDWRHVSVAVEGWQKARRRTSRPALPTWWDLSHLVYEHAELGFDPMRDVIQFLPPPDEYVNLAEALHLEQPA